MRLRDVFYRINANHTAPKSSDVIHDDNASVVYGFLRRRYVYLLTVIVLLLFCITRLSNIKVLPAHYDEATYIGWSQNAWSGNMSAQMKNGKPPLHSLAMMPFLKLFSDPIVAARMLSVLCGLLSLVGIVLIGREILDLKMGVWAGLLWTISPYTLTFDRLGLADSMLTMLLVFAVYFALRAVMQDDSWYLVGTGVITGLALLTKQSAQILFLIIPFAYFARGPRQKEMARKRPLVRWLCTVVPALLLGYAISSLLRFTSYYRYQSIRTNIVSKTIPELLRNPFNLFPSNSKTILYHLWSYLTPVLFMLCLVGIILGLIVKWRPAYFLLAWFVISFSVCALIAKFQYARNWMMVLPPLILGASFAARTLTAMVFKYMEGISRGKFRLAGTSAVILASAALLFAVAIPAARADARLSFPSSKERTYDKQAYRGVIDEIRMLSRRNRLLVWAYDSYSRNVLRMYLTDEKDVEIIYVGSYLKVIPPKVLRANSTGDSDIYVVSLLSSKGVPDNWPLKDIKKFTPVGNEHPVIVCARIVMPSIQAMRPYSGSVGQTVTIRGFNFGEKQGASSVRFQGIPATIYARWTENTIVTIVPSGISGFADVRVHTESGASWGMRFIVLSSSRP